MLTILSRSYKGMTTMMRTQNLRNLDHVPPCHGIRTRARAWCPGMQWRRLLNVLLRTSHIQLLPPPRPMNISPWPGRIGVGISALGFSELSKKNNSFKFEYIIYSEIIVAVGCTFDGSSGRRWTLDGDLWWTIYFFGGSVEAPRSESICTFTILLELKVY
jgi:hypothetical protein